MDCGTLSDPINGGITFTPESDTTFNSQATYTCDDGFTIESGDENRFCTPEGIWNGTAPTCQRKSVAHQVNFAVK